MMCTPTNLDDVMMYEIPKKVVASLFRPSTLACFYITPSRRRRDPLCRRQAKQGGGREGERGTGRERREANRNTCVAAAVRPSVRPSDAQSLAERGAPVSPRFPFSGESAFRVRTSAASGNSGKKEGGCRTIKGRTRTQTGGRRQTDLGMTSGECLDLRATRENGAR